MGDCAENAGARGHIGPGEVERRMLRINAAPRTRALTVQFRCVCSVFRLLVGVWRFQCAMNAAVDNLRWVVTDRCLVGPKTVLSLSVAPQLGGAKVASGRGAGLLLAMRGSDGKADSRVARIVQ